MMLQQQDRNYFGGYAPDFELPGTDSQVHHLARYLENFQVVAVVFLGNSCPLVNLYLERLKQIQTDFSKQGFTLIGINANDVNQVPEDSFEMMKEFAAQKQLNFPYLWDPSQDVALCFDAKVAPEVFLLNAQGVICYQGAIDDCPEKPDLVERNYLRDNIVNLLRGESMVHKTTNVTGCALKWRNK